MEAFPGTEESSVIKVHAAPLDSLLQRKPLHRPVLLKIDAQGAELDVLLGAEGTLQHVDEVFVECSFVTFYGGQALAGEVIAHLESRGLHLVGVHSVVRDRAERCLQADFLFTRRGSS